MKPKQQDRSAAVDVKNKACVAYVQKLTDPESLSEDDRTAIGWAFSFGFDAGFDAGWDAHAAAGQQGEAEVTPMLLWCPRCFEQHIDEAKPDICEKCGIDVG